MKRSGAALLLGLGLAVLPSLRLAAQTDPRLVAAVRLAQDGLSDSARAVAARILAALQPTDSLYPEALYTVGLLAGTERARRLDREKNGVPIDTTTWQQLLEVARKVRLNDTEVPRVA